MKEEILTYSGKELKEVLQRSLSSVCNDFSYYFILDGDRYTLYSNAQLPDKAQYSVRLVHVNDRDYYTGYVYEVTALDSIAEKAFKDIAVKALSKVLYNEKTLETEIDKLCEQNPKIPRKKIEEIVSTLSWLKSLTGKDIVHMQCDKICIGECSNVNFDNSSFKLSFSSLWELNLSLGELMHCEYYANEIAYPYHIDYKDASNIRVLDKKMSKLRNAEENLIKVVQQLVKAPPANVTLYAKSMISDEVITCVAPANKLNSAMKKEISQQKKVILDMEGIVTITITIGEMILNDLYDYLGDKLELANCSETVAFIFSNIIDKNKKTDNALLG